MDHRDEELIEALLPQNSELKAAYEEHRRLDAEVDKLSAKSFLSPSEQVERKNLQKLKLVEKDKIMRILAEHRRGAVASESA